MSSFSSFILERGVASLPELEELLRVQTLHGGDLGSHLLGAGLLDEPKLLELLAEYHGLPPGPLGRLPAPEPKLAKLMPPGTARRYQLVPLGVTPQHVHLATAQPIEREVLDEVGRFLGHAVHLVQVTPLRLREALWRHASLPLSATLRQILARIDGADAVAQDPPSLLPRAPIAGEYRPYRRMILRTDDKVVAAEGHPSASFLSSMLRGRAQAYPIGGDEPELEVSAEALELDETYPEGMGFGPGTELDSVPDGPATLRTGAVLVDVAAAAFAEEPEWAAEAAEGRAVGTEPSGDAAFDSTPPPPPGTEAELEPEPEPMAVDAGAEISTEESALLPEDERETVVPASQPEELAAVPEDERETVVPASQPDGAADEPASVRVALGAELRAADERRRSAPTSMPGFVHRGPLTRNVAELALGEATEAQQVLEVFARFARQFFERSILFAVQSGRAEARLAHGMPLTVTGWHVPLDEPSVLQLAHDSAQIVVAVLTTSGQDAELRAVLANDQLMEVAVVPVLVRQRVVALLYADDYAVGIDRDALAEVAGFGNLVGNALAMLIVRRKRERSS